MKLRAVGMGNIYVHVIVLVWFCGIGAVLSFPDGGSWSLIVIVSFYVTGRSGVIYNLCAL